MNKDDQLKLLGARIRECRVAAGLSQESLAFSVGYKSRTSINKIELGKTDIVQSVIKKIADTLNTTPAYLMGGSDDPYIETPTPVSEDGIEGEARRCFESLSPEKKREALNYLHYLLKSEDK